MSSGSQGSKDEQRSQARSASDKEPEVKEFPEGEGPGPGYGLKGKKDFKDAEIKSGEEKLDTRYTGASAGEAKNDAKARTKTGLADVQLARPDPVKDPGQQPIPLEYQDVLE
jgi:hypothetical protein